MNESSAARASLSFSTEGVWSAADVLTLVGSTAAVFDAFLATTIVRRREEQYFEILDLTMRRAYEYMDHPIYHELYHLWREYFDMCRKEERLLPLTPPFPFPYPMSQVRPEETISSYQVFQEIDSFARDEDRLQVRRINVASPGEFSFSGSGEIVREIRELIKDIWYRNKQERVRGELEIIEKYLSIRRENSDLQLPPLTGKVDMRLVKVVQEKVHALRRLEDGGKLRCIAEHMETEEE